MSSDFADTGHKLWWKGAKGEWFVIAQVVLIGMVFFGPRTISGQPDWTFPFPQTITAIGGIFMVCGGGLFFAGLVSLGRGLTPLPYPKEGAKLIRTGAYSLVRHPMYSGGLVLCLGWALYVQGWLTLGYVIALSVLIDVKSRYEEKWLTEKFPTKYASYKKRVRKLIPFVY